MPRTNNFFEHNVLEARLEGPKRSLLDDDRFQATPSKEAMKKEVPWRAQVAKGLVDSKFSWCYFVIDVYIYVYIYIYMYTCISK